MFDLFRSYPGATLFLLFLVVLFVASRFLRSRDGTDVPRGGGGYEENGRGSLDRKGDTAKPRNEGPRVE